MFWASMCTIFVINMPGYALTLIGNDTNFNGSRLFKIKFCQRIVILLFCVSKIKYFHTSEKVEIMVLFSGDILLLRRVAC